MQLLETVGSAFSEVLANKGVELGLPFAGERLLEMIGGATARNPVAVLVLDAFRFELGKRLANLLNESEPATRAEVEAARAPLPSMTALGMAYCLPISSDSLRMSALDACASRIGFLKRIRCLSLSHSLKRFMELTGLQADDARFPLRSCA
jgi:PglZ domain